jgi:hypothetical protein
LGKNTTIVPKSLPQAEQHRSKDKGDFAALTWPEVCAVNHTLTRQVFTKAQKYGYEIGKRFEDYCP